MEIVGLPIRDFGEALRLAPDAPSTALPTPRGRFPRRLTPWRPPMTGHHRPKPAAFLLLPVAFAIILALFAWPNAEAGPRDLPIGVAGQPAQTRAIEQGLAARGEAFDIHRYADEATAREAIEDRDIYGAFVATPDGPKVLTATAASAPVATLLTHAADESGAEVEDVTAASARAGALPSSVLPLLIGGILVGVASIALATSPLQRAGLVLGGSLLMGLTATLLIQGWLDVLGGDWAANAAGLQPHDGRHRGRGGRARGGDRPSRHRSRGADDGVRRQPVLGRRRRAPHAA